MIARGKFITFEGIEGSGKSTQVGLLCDALVRARIEHLKTREPGGTRQGEDLRRVFLGHEWDGVAETFLLMASRRAHVMEAIEPSLELGDWVVCDRFAKTTIAYQGHGRGFPLILLHEMHRAATGWLEPDLTFILDIPAEVGLERARNRGETDRMERLDVSFFERVRIGFRSIASVYSDQCVLLDALKEQEEIHANVLRTVRDRFSVELACLEPSDGTPVLKTTRTRGDTNE